MQGGLNLVIAALAVRGPITARLGNLTVSYTGDGKREALALNSHRFLLTGANLRKRCSEAASR
jgi:hypothetical protein